MNVKTMGTGLAFLVAGVVSVAGSAWYFSERGDARDGPQISQASAVAPGAAVGDGAYAVPLSPNRPDTDLSAVTGRWAGGLDIGGGNMVEFSFNLLATGDQLTGTATFPIGDGSIQDGRVEGNQLSFLTRHQLQRTGPILVTRFSGSVGDGVIDLDMQSEGGNSKLTINRVSH